MNWLAIIISIWNVIIMLLYAVDKRRAKRSKWRISENGLIVPAFLFGSIGAMLGMILFNHKTSKMKFRLLIPLAYMSNIGMVLLLNYLTR